MATINHKRKYMGGVLTLLLLLIGFNTLAAEQRSVEDRTTNVVGSAVIQGEDLAAAREQAITNSLGVALHATVERLIDAQTLVEWFQAVDRELYSRPNDYIQGFRVLAESTFGGHYRVMVQTTVAADKVAAKLTDLGVLTPQQGLPRILLLLSEQNVNDVQPIFWWGKNLLQTPMVTEVAAESVLSESAFEVIDRRQVSAALDYPQMLSDEQAIELGRRLNAQVVIIGQAAAEARPSSVAGTLRSFSAFVTARALRVETGKVIASDQKSALAVGEADTAAGRQALENAATLITQSLAGQIAESWRQAQSGSGQLSVLVEGTGGQIASFVRFRSLLGSIPGVKGLQLTEMNANSAVMAVDYQGSPRGLAEALLGQPYDTFGINIYEISENGLKIKLVPK